MPSFDPSLIRINLGVGAIVATSAYVKLLARCPGSVVGSSRVSFFGTGAINLGVAFVFGLLPSRHDAYGASLVLAALLIGLLTLLVVLSDRFRFQRLDSMELGTPTANSG